MRRDRANTESIDDAGQDSFLDVVTNIVGIIILLVMVVSVRATRHASTTPETAESPAGPVPAVSEQQLQEALALVLGERQETEQLVRRAVNVRNSAMLRDEERVRLNTVVTAMAREIEDRRAKLSEAEQREFDLRRQINSAQETLDELTSEQIALLSAAPEVETIDCLPTPLARSVSGTEVHLQLCRSHVAHIPLDDLLTEFKQHADSNLWQLRDRPGMINTVGPLEGFRLRYQLERTEMAIRDAGGGMRQGSLVQLTKWELLPASPNLGEQVDQAILPTSALAQTLKRYSPESTTVTVWTYPDSFGSFRTLKSALFERGFAVAARPLPAGLLIGGSPNGTKSVAQ
jgi:hypothetical protein